MFTYSFPYWWDYVVWFTEPMWPLDPFSSRSYTDQGRPSIEGARQLGVSFRKSDGHMRVFEVTRAGPYSRTSRVVKFAERQ